MEVEKLMLQVSDEWGDKAFPLDWNMLPEDIMDKVSPDYYYNILSYSNGEIKEKTVIYFRKVKKFRKGITAYEQPDVIFGI